MRTLIIVILIGVFGLCYFEMTFAEITIEGESVHVETDAYAVQFDKGVITHIHNKLTDATYTIGESKQGLSGMLNWERRNISTRRATLESTTLIDPVHAVLLFRHADTEIRLFISIDRATDDMLINIEGKSNTPGVMGMQWGAGYLDTDNLSLISPIHGGRIIDPTNPIDFHIHAYPSSSWEAQLVIMQSEHGGFFVRNTDNTFQFKHFIFDRKDNGSHLQFVTLNQSPFDTHTSAKSDLWRFNTYHGDWRVPARLYRDWMEQTFDARRLSDIDWLEDISLFVGSARSRIGLTNTALLDRLAELVDPTRTVVMLKRWANGGEWWSEEHHDPAPDYFPKPEMGRFIEAAHQHGFRVIPWIPLLGFSPSHPLYPHFRQYQIRDTRTGVVIEPVPHPHPEFHPLTTMNPASSEFRNLIVQRLKAVWEEYGVDGFFLDANHFVMNDGNGLIDGLNMGQGMDLLHRELAEAMPGIIFGGERLHEASFARVSLAQRPPLGVKLQPHPISSFLFAPFAHAISTAPRNPDRAPDFHQQHTRYEEIWGVMPTLNIWDVWQLGEEYVEAHKILLAARTWQQPDFYAVTGDVNQDGQVNVLDLILVASSFGEQPPSNPQADTNKDGVVNLLDLVFVAESLSQNAAAPAQLAFIESIPPSAKEVIAAHRALNELQAIPNKTPRIQIAIELLRHYLAIADQKVQETKLLPNYPNPFNPDTWIPYQLSEGSRVTVKIYDIRGHLVRTIDVGHKPVGYYLTRERAIYWDGRNKSGEPVSSGVYFYTLNIDTDTQTRRMVIVK